MNYIRRTFFVLTLFFYEFTSQSKMNINSSFFDVCTSMECNCNYSTRTCFKRKNLIMLQQFSQTVNSSTELFLVTSCDSADGQLFFEWMQPASSSLRRLKINDCALRRVAAENVSQLNAFQQLEEVDLSFNHINDIQENELSLLLPNLTTLNLRSNSISHFRNLSNLSYLVKLDLSRNQYSEMPNLPAALRLLNISHNLIRTIEDDDFETTTRLETLDVSYCKIDAVHPASLKNLLNLKTLILTGNRIQNLAPTVFAGLSQLEIIDLSSNKLKEFDAQNLLLGLMDVKSLVLDKNPIRRLTRFPADLFRLTNLSIAHTDLMYFDLFVVSALRNLNDLVLRDNSHLRSCVGVIAEHAPTLRRLDVSNCALTQLRTEFFKNVTILEKINLTGNPWACDCRLQQWYDQLQSIPNVKISISLDLNASSCSNRTQPCDIGVAASSGSIVRTTHGSDTILDCGPYGDPSPEIVWEQPIRRKIFGHWPADNDTRTGADRITDSEKHSLLPGGLLLLHRAIRDDVGPYRCTVSNRNGNASALLFLRLDYSNWWEMKLYSVVCGIITAIGFFILNVIYAAIRRLIIWRISKLEQTSRVRLLLEAMEKYRQRQMESLHDKYTAKMHQIRENYNAQFDQMRRSYVAQTERFRDYRAAQMEYMSQHIESLRDNYNWQTTRVREYGSRQMERLWESYQRQVTRLRAFSLQQRLRLMRQYKIKQQSWNKMFDSINVEGGSQQMNGHVSVAIHPELIELPELPPTGVDDLTHPADGSEEEMVHGSPPDEFDDAISQFIFVTNQTLDETDDQDGSSYHSASSSADFGLLEDEPLETNPRYHRPDDEGISVEPEFAQWTRH